MVESGTPHAHRNQIVLRLSDQPLEIEQWLIPTGSTSSAGRRMQGTWPGPVNTAFNASIVKDTFVRERLNVQLRVEAFNLFDRANFDLPDNFVGSPTFGRIQSAQSPRRVQLGLKFLF